ncbi:MAG: UDP-N-acetylglucosamine--N-acetylmuramyl-(pentapeptide) pyrophosphoryl-undecaprenol N-acetylglucosamine transferase [Chloroflexi bacterium ADurb.Bin222]|nr:MAG: UDP-N-acetylglucosamine--N-acetylmuramyl-(pentapeptide) pyrophosphoryl-undecaprenol N-acetylglucosamine transferase [Chloroflexi bacterium ADurb.Bin222]
MRAIDPDVALTWIGGKGGMEAELVQRAGVPFTAIPAGGVHGVALGRALFNAWQLVRGFFAALRLLRRERPAAVLTTGGYVSVPVAVAARLRRVPVLLYVPDIEPGTSFRWVARLATQIAVTVEESRPFLPARKVVVTGYPLREDLGRWEREAARRVLGLAAEAPVLLVFGGSRGARSINEAVMANLEPLLALTQVVHVTGALDWEKVAAQAAALPEAARGRYHAFPYLHEEMGAALAAADLALSRAGASVLGEFPFFGLPAILVPYPHAWRYQKVNAEWLAQRGAAVVTPDETLATTLLPLVSELLRSPERCAALRAAAQELARPDAARRIADLMLSWGQGA